MPIQISAIVCTYERYASLVHTLDSLQHQTLSRSAYEVLVADNSPVADRREFAQAHPEFSRIRFLPVLEPGLSSARNAALAEAGADLVAFIDDDAVASPEWLARIVNAFAAADANVAAIGGRVYPLWETPRPPWLHDILAGYLSILDWGDQPLEIDSSRWLIGTNVAYRRAALQTAGGFRLDLGRRGELLLSNDELELNDRLRQACLRIRYDPHIEVFHRIPKDRLTQNWLRRRVFWQAVSDLLANRAWPAELARSIAGPAVAETKDPQEFLQECDHVMQAVLRLSQGYASESPTPPLNVAAEAKTADNAHAPAGPTS